MREITDALTLITLAANADDNAMFVRSGKSSAPYTPYCAFSLRTDAEALDFATWGTTEWVLYETLEEYLNHTSDSPAQRATRGRVQCAGCRRTINTHKGPGSIAVAARSPLGERRA